MTLQQALDRIFTKRGRDSRRHRLATETPVPTPEWAGDDSGRQWYQTDTHLEGCPTVEYVVERVGDDVTLSLVPALDVGWSINGKGRYQMSKHSVGSGDLRKVLEPLSPGDVQPFLDVLHRGRAAWVDTMREAATVLAGVGNGTHVVDCVESVAAFVRFDVGLDVLTQIDATIALLTEEVVADAGA